MWLVDLDAAGKESLASGKPILADFQGSDWCPSCQELHKKVFSSKRFADWAARSVVLLDVDLPQDRTHQPLAIRTANEALAARHNVSEFPAVLILDAGGAKLAAVDLNSLDFATVTPSTFIALAETAVSSARKNGIPGKP